MFSLCQQKISNRRRINVVRRTIKVSIESEKYGERKEDNKILEEKDGEDILGEMSAEGWQQDGGVG